MKQEKNGIFCGQRKIWEHLGKKIAEGRTGAGVLRDWLSADLFAINILLLLLLLRIQTELIKNIQQTIAGQNVAWQLELTTSTHTWVLNVARMMMMTVVRLVSTFRS